MAAKKSKSTDVGPGRPQNGTDGHRDPAPENESPSLSGEEIPAENGGREPVEEALRENQRLIQSITEATPDIIYIFDLIERRVLYVNRRGRELLGYTIQEIEAKGKAGYRELVHPDAWIRVEQALRRWDTAQDEDILEFQCRLKAKNGQWHWFRNRAKVFRRGADGRVEQIIGTARDITGRKETEEKLERMQAQLAHVGRLSTMGEMVAGITHEVAQPLYSILNFTKAARNVLASGRELNVNELREWNDEIAAAAARAGEMIARLRRFVRRSDAQRSLVDVNEIARESIDLVAPEARRCQVAVHLELSPARPSVSVDHVQIQQVLVNLLHNACEAMAEKTAGARQVTIRTEVVGEVVEVSVADNGPGLPSNQELKIFDAFVTTKPDGLGMGLAISKTIIEAHGGRLWATSTRDQGATFHFMLPIARGDWTDVK